MKQSKAERKEYVFRCFGYPDKNNGVQGYTAACIDLGLVTFRPTLTEAKDSLGDAIHGYFAASIKQANERDLDLDHLLHRPISFWPYRAKYHAVLTFINFASIFSGGKRFAVFDSPTLAPA